MALQWTGDFELLKRAVQTLGRVGCWNELSAPYRFDGSLGEVIRFWPTTKSVQVQGTNAATLEEDLKKELGLERTKLDFGD